MTATVLNWTFSSTLIEFFFCFYPNTHWDAEQLCMQLVHWKHNDDLLYSALWKWVMFGYLSSRSELHLYMEKTAFMTQCYATATCAMCFICMVFVSVIAHNTLTFVVVVYFYFSSYIFCQQQQIKR